ncbi:MAG: O-antigen ligase family protein, partial [Anaerolineaceae bacterium]|nr:O-antigen ligase family protein [Anaerolineaceae bacterium]
WVSRGDPKIRGADVPFLILLGMALLGYAISIERALSWPRLCSILLGLIIFIELRRALQPRQWASWIALGLIVVGLGMAGVSLVGTDWTQVRMFDLPWVFDRLPTLVRGLPDSGAFKNTSDLFGPRWVGITMGVLAPIYLPMLAWRERSWLRWLAAGAFLLVTLTLLLTQSLQGLIGLLAGSLIVLLCASRWFWLLVPVGLAAAAGLLALIDLPKFGTLLLSIDNPGGIAVVLRLDMWSRAVAMIRDMPFTGIGLNTFPLIQSQFYPGIFIGPEAHSHNLYLQLALDLGLPGLFAFVWFVILWIVGLLRALAKENASNARLLMVSTLAGMAAYLAHGVMDAQMPGAKPGFVIWSLLGIGAALMAPLGEAKKSRIHTWVLSVLVLPFVMGLLAIFQPSSVYMNLGAVQAHKVLSPFPAAQITSPADFEAAQRNLEEALRLDPSLRQAHLLLGRFASVQGDFSAAIKYYENRVALDMVDPVAAYDPALELTLLITSDSPPAPAEELGRIYHNWNKRFPNRAEGYLLRSILYSQYQANPSTGANFLKMGIEANALPPGLLAYALSQK